MSLWELVERRRNWTNWCLVCVLCVKFFVQLTATEDQTRNLGTFTRTAEHFDQMICVNDEQCRGETKVPSRTTAGFFENGVGNSPCSLLLLQRYRLH